MRMMKGPGIVSAAALIALIGAMPRASLSQTTSAEPEAAIQAKGTPTQADIRQRMSEVARRLQEAKLASYSSPLPQGEYIEAQRQIARGDYREAMNHLNQADQELDGIPNLSTARR
jgi:hypothetical protein